MTPYIPTIAASTAATSIFHLPKVIPTPADATLAQISTAASLFVLRSATTTPKPKDHCGTYMAGAGNDGTRKYDPLVANRLPHRTFLSKREFTKRNSSCSLGSLSKRKL